jgi:hypothetical protein
MFTCSSSLGTSTQCFGGESFRSETISSFAPNADFTPMLVKFTLMAKGLFLPIMITLSSARKPVGRDNSRLQRQSWHPNNYSDSTLRADIKISIWVTYPLAVLLWCRWVLCCWPSGQSFDSPTWCSLPGSGAMPGNSKSLSLMSRGNLSELTS